MTSFLSFPCTLETMKELMERALVVRMIRVDTQNVGMIVTTLPANTMKVIAEGHITGCTFDFGGLLADDS